MKSFKTFLYEDMKDPVGSAQKFARREMERNKNNPSVPPVIDYEHENQNPEQRLYIRTRNYDRNEASDVLDRLLKREDRIIGKRTWAEGRPLIAAREVPRTLPIKSLRATQDVVDVADAETLRKKMAHDPQTTEDRVRVIKSGRGKKTKYHIADGHHRVLGYILAKKQEVPVRVFDLDPPRKKKRNKNAKQTRNNTRNRRSAS